MFLSATPNLWKYCFCNSINLNCKIRVSTYTICVLKYKMCVQLQNLCFQIHTHVFNCKIHVLKYQMMWQITKWMFVITKHVFYITKCVIWIKSVYWIRNACFKLQEWCFKLQNLYFKIPKRRKHPRFSKLEMQGLALWHDYIPKCYLYSNHVFVWWAIVEWTMTTPWLLCAWSLWGASILD